MKKVHRKVSKLIHPYGLRLQPSRGRGHYHIVDENGTYVASMAMTPKNDVHCGRNTLALLVRSGHLPATMKGAL